MNFLTDQERAQLKSQHKQERDGRIRDRIKAILLLRRRMDIVTDCKSFTDLRPGCS